MFKLKVKSRTDGRTHDGHRVMTKAHWLLAIGTENGMLFHTYDALKWVVTKINEKSSRDCLRNQNLSKGASLQTSEDNRRRVNFTLSLGTFLS